MKWPKWLKVSWSTKLDRTHEEQMKDITELIKNSRLVDFNGAIIEQYYCKSCGEYSNHIITCTHCREQMK
jgi:hypothetical protein